MTTEAEIKEWLSGYPRAWNQLCQALMWQMCNRFGHIETTPPSAITAYGIEYDAGRISHTSPPDGVFVYFDIGADGHVGFTMNDGRVLMASSHLIEEWVTSDAGYSTLDKYVKDTGATYLGWSKLNGGNSMSFTPNSSTPSGGGANPVTPNSKDETMALRQMHYKDASKNTIRGLFSEESGYFTRWQSNTGDIANSISSIWGAGPSVEVTESLFSRIESDMAATRQGK